MPDLDQEYGRDYTRKIDIPVPVFAALNEELEQRNKQLASKDDQIKNLQEKVLGFPPGDIVSRKVKDRQGFEETAAR